MSWIPRSLLGWTNFLIVQWFFIRIAKTEDADTGEHIRWSVIGPVWPLTGWWSNYWWVWRP